MPCGFTFVAHAREVCIVITASRALSKLEDKYIFPGLLWQCTLVTRVLCFSPPYHRVPRSRNVGDEGTSLVCGTSITSMLLCLAGADLGEVK